MRCDEEPEKGRLYPYGEDHVITLTEEGSALRNLSMRDMFCFQKFWPISGWIRRQPEKTHAGWSMY